MTGEDKIEITDADLKHLSRAVDLAEEALEAGDAPFGSVLVGENGEVLFEDHNHVAGGDATRHPEFEIARWAAKNLPPESRIQATVYTSGEHCPMCAAAHGFVGLGRVVYATSSAELTSWREELGLPRGPVAPLPIESVALDVFVQGPVETFEQRVKNLQQKYWLKQR